MYRCYFFAKCMNVSLLNYNINGMVWEDNKYDINEIRKIF